MTRTRDLVALLKPRITVMVVLTAATGMYLAPGGLPLGRALLSLLGTVLLVGGANAMNMYLEREIDGRAARTANRPLPAGRLPPIVALLVGLGLADRLGEHLPGGVISAGGVVLHPLVLIFAVSGSLMISKTVRIPKP